MFVVTMRLHNILRQYFLCQFSLLSSFTLRGKKSHFLFKIFLIYIRERTHLHPVSQPTPPWTKLQIYIWSIYNSRNLFLTKFLLIIFRICSISHFISDRSSLRKLFSLQLWEKRRRENFNRIRKIQLSRRGVSLGDIGPQFLFIYFV